MTEVYPSITRRAFVGAAAATGAGAALGIGPAAAATPLVTRAIPKTGEQVPVIGMGTWITFNVGRVTRLRNARAEVLRTFFAMGGGVIDSSPMYGSAEEVVGYGLRRLGDTGNLFSATKVWTRSPSRGRDQIGRSFDLWGVRRFDLLQVHNLLNWEAHLETLFEMKRQGRLRYVGITTSHGWRHDEMERLMKTQPIDFVQLTYNIRDREAEARLLPLAAERRLGVIVNRPFRRGSLIDGYGRRPLPAWAREFDCANWPQFFLKFIVSHPAVSCAIPATSRVDHMRENMGAARGRLPTPELRRRMVHYFEAL